MQATFPEDKCENGRILSTTRPAETGLLVDCTADNDCSSSSTVSVMGHGLLHSLSPSSPLEPVMGHGSSEILWIVGYDSSDCRGKPKQTLKVNFNSCTIFPDVAFPANLPACEGLSCFWFSQGCGIGCTECTGDKTTCNSTKQPTINDPKFRTFNRYGRDVAGDWTASHPWRAPGSAPVFDPCGIAGGSTKNNDENTGFIPAGHKMGDKGSQLVPSTKSVWTAGSRVEVVWGISNNHGGGYQYRLCPKSEQLTEECFQRMPLPFASTQTLRWRNGTQLKIPATLVSVGTVPDGSSWAMNPVPPCSGTNCNAPQFPPPPGCDETCWRSSAGTQVLPLVVDELMLPENIGHGDYVLSWRWDCEGTVQIWTSCADVVVVGKPHNRTSWSAAPDKLMSQGLFV